MKLVIIISTYNRYQFLEKLLINIRNQTLPSGLLVEAIVINAGSSDGTIDNLKKYFPEVKIIEGNSNWWWTKCINEGFKKAIEIKSDFVLILNDDVEIKKDYLSILLKDYDTLPKGSILGSASISIDKPHLIASAGTKKFIKWRFKFMPYYEFKIPDENFFGIHPTYTLSGRGTLIPTGTFNKIGYYDDKLVQYGSDDEFIIRARNAGIPVFISWNARIYIHLLMTSEGTAFRKDSFWQFIKSFSNPYSVNSIKKTALLYKKYGIKILTPFYLVYFILGTIKAYLFKYRRI